MNEQNAFTVAAPAELELLVYVRHPERDVDVQLNLSASRTLALIGPNGSGKSTVMATIAGTIPSPPSSVRVGTNVWQDSSRWLPAHQRDCAYLAQNPLLFPHMTCLDNVAYGLRARAGLPKRVARREAGSFLERVGAQAWGTRYPTQLSGGQATRVALARALATRPSVVLLDEPFAALDVDSAHEMRQLCTDLLADTPTIIATHSVADVRALAQDVAILGKGRLVDSMDVDEFLTTPISKFAHRFVHG